MSTWTRSGTRPSAASTAAGSGSVSRKLPPDDHSTSISPRPRCLDHLRRRAAALGADREAVLGLERRAADSAAIGTPPGNTVA